MHGLCGGHLLGSGFDDCLHAVPRGELRRLNRSSCVHRLFGRDVIINRICVMRKHLFHQRARDVVTVSVYMRGLKRDPGKRVFER